MNAGSLLLRINPLNEIASVTEPCPHEKLLQTLAIAGPDNCDERPRLGLQDRMRLYQPSA